MSQIERNMFLLAVILIICGVSEAAVYKVGDSSGWTSIGHVDYKSWAASKHFRVGDTIVFQYTKEFHNVVRVTHDNYNLCNATGSYGVWGSGNDSFTIPRSGHYFFICGYTGHCAGGQRVDIRVPGTPSPKSAPAHSPIAHPPTAVPAPHVAPKLSPTPTHAPKASSPHVAPKSSPTPAHAPKASTPHVAPKSYPTPTHAPKASTPHVAPKSSPTTPTPTPAPKASSPHVAPKSSPTPTATPPAPKASSPDSAPNSSDLPPSEPTTQAPAPSPTSGATRSWATKHIFFIGAIVSIFCF